MKPAFLQQTTSLLPSLQCCKGARFNVFTINEQEIARLRDLSMDGTVILQRVLTNEDMDWMHVPLDRFRWRCI